MAGEAAGAPEVARALRDAVAAGSVVPLGLAISAAEKAKLDPQEIAAAKRALFGLQRERREQAKQERARAEASAALEAAAAGGGDIQLLRGAIESAEVAGVAAPELERARALLREMEGAERGEVVELAVEDAEYAISQGDVVSATLALEEAAAEGADEGTLAALGKALQELQERLDPENAARCRRLEARKSSEKQKKWNYAGKSNNPIINDKFREHEAELERRRMLAFRGRGRYRGEAEDQGEEGQEKEVRRQRAEINRERGCEPTPLQASEPARGFRFGCSPKEEAEPARKLRLRAHREMGAGIDVHASWWGMVVDIIDDEPGQPGLRLQDVLVEISGTSLQELGAEACEQLFCDHFADGCEVTVEPHVALPGVLAGAGGIDRSSLQSDLECFAVDWGVEVKAEECGGDRLRIVLAGPRSGVRASRAELQKLLDFYAHPEPQ